MHERIAIPEHLDGGVWSHAWRARLHPRHSHAELELNLVLAGKGSYLLPDRREPLSRGTLIWLFPGHEHMLADISPDFRMWILVVRPRLVRRLVQSRALPEAFAAQAPAGRWSRRLSEPVLRAVDGLLGEVAQTSTPVAFNAGLTWVLSRIGAAFAHGTEVASRAAVHPAVRDVLRWLSDVGAPPSAQAMAHRCGLSPDHLARVFRHEMGMRIAEYRNQIRVERAQALIAAGADDLVQVALDAGFGSYTHFHRSCVRIAGTRPSEMARR